MKRIAIVAALAAWALMPYPLFAQFIGLTTELVAVDGAPGVNTYRIYAEFGNPNDELVAIFGIEADPLILSSSTTFYHPAGGSGTTLDVNPTIVSLVPELAFDSWLTIGLENQTGNEASSIGFDFSDWINLGADLVVNDPFGAVFFTLPGSAQNFPVDGRVLMAQLSSSGTIDGEFNIQWRSAAGDSFNETGLFFSIIPGCTDPTATNYDPSATIEDGSCLFALPSFENLTWELVANNTIPGFNTYRVYANFSNPGDELTAVFGQSDNPLIIETSGTFYQNPLAGAYSTSITPFILGADPNAAFDSWVTIGAESSNNNALQNIGVNVAPFEAGGTLAINDPSGGAWFVFPGDQPSAFPDSEGRVLIAQLTTDGVVDLTVNLQYRATDGSNPQEFGLNLVFPDIILGCTDPTACNFNSSADTDDGSCLFLDACGNCGGTATAGCTDPTACNFDGSASCDDGSCLFLDACGNCGGTATAGCTNPAACNFDGSASCDDGSCLFLDACGNCGGTATAGCTDPTACNFDASAGCDDSSCEFASCAGCTNPSAPNFDPSATIDDGSCLIDGCTYPAAANYDATATVDNGSCLFPGCTDPGFDNYNPYANVDDGSCADCAGGGGGSCIGDLNNDGVINAADLGTFLTVFGTTCN